MKKLLKAVAARTRLILRFLVYFAKGGRNPAWRIWVLLLGSAAFVVASFQDFRTLYPIFLIGAFVFMGVVWASWENFRGRNA